MKDLKIVKTADGSHSLYVEALDEHYHSHHGSIQEALHVFIEAGLNYKKSKLDCSILEVGFGTGLNAFLAARYAKHENKKIHYTGVELFPIPKKITSQLNYLEKFKVEEDLTAIFEAIHDVKWEEVSSIITQFDLIKHKGKIQDIRLVDHSFDFVFYDAFGPRAQKEMWDIAIFEKLYQSLRPGGILVTYCAMGQLKRDLKSVGFEVQSIPGPPGKREMTRAIK